MARGVCICKNCGKKIRFVVRKSDKKRIPVSGKAVYVSPKYNCSDTYYTSDGREIKGIYDENGYACYEPHICIVQKEGNKNEQ